MADQAERRDLAQVLDGFPAVPEPPGVRWAMGSQAVTSSSRTASRSGPSGSPARRPKRAMVSGASSCRRRAEAFEGSAGWADWGVPGRMVGVSMSMRIRS
ncbi:hypothetical protein STENM327S_01361 [Streptomyces tendae]